MPSTIRSSARAGARRAPILVVVALVALVVGCGSPGQPPATSTTTTSSTTSTTVAPPTGQGNPFAGERFYVDPASTARNTVNQWKAQGRTADAQQLEKIAGAPKPVRYFAEWTEQGNSN